MIPSGRAFGDGIEIGAGPTLSRAGSKPGSGCVEDAIARIAEARKVSEIIENLLIKAGLR
jgi:hypothetical protein